MRKYLGRAAFGAGIAAWGLLMVALFVGGTNPDSRQLEFLRTASRGGLAMAVVALPLGAIALIIGPHRLAALVGLMLSILFFLYFAGMFLVFTTS